jgi:hypothetical protein
MRAGAGIRPAISQGWAYMIEGDLQRVRRWPRRVCALALLTAIGCGDAGVERAEQNAAHTPALLARAPRQADVAWARPLLPPTAGGIEPAGLMSLPSEPANRPQAVAEPELTLLPTVEVEEAEQVAVEMPDAGPKLLPPQPLEAGFTEWHDASGATPLEAESSANPSTENSLVATEPLASYDILPTPETPAGDASLALPPSISDTTTGIDGSLSLEAEELLADAGPTVTGHLTGAMVSEQALAKIRRGYKLAQRGAYFAAREQFLEVLRMIAEAKDQKRGLSRRSVALANGLRALEEAADFTPRGPGIDNRLDFAVIIASHRTPVAKSGAGDLMPQQLSDLYYRYAQLQLGASVAGEPAGSMALHALGKLYSQIGRAEPGRIVQAERRAFSLQQAALLAREDNHLAAHELGVLLAEAGHFVDSEFILAQVAAREPHPVVYRNLARIQRKLGREDLATVSESQAHHLAAQGMSSVSGVQWVDPQTLARTGDPLAPTAPAPQVAAGPPIPQPRPAATATTQAPAPTQSEPVHNITRLPGGYFR